MQRMITIDDLESLSGGKCRALGSLGMMANPGRTMRRTTGQPDGNVPVPQQALWRRAERGESACREQDAPKSDAQPRDELEGQKKHKFLDTYCQNLTKKARDGQLDRIVGREVETGTDHSDPQPTPEEQPLPDRRAGRRQDRHCGGLARRSQTATCLQTPRQEVYLMDGGALVMERSSADSLKAV